jgi:sortase A
MKCSSRIERWLLISGLLLIAIYFGTHLHKTILCRAELRQFRHLQTQQSVETSLGFPAASRFKVDFSLWSKKRIAAYESSLAEHFDPALAVLRISKLHFEVPVLEGTDDVTLNRGVGHIAGTSRPGSDGNVGIAGHRDGFFRVLKDIGRGDIIELLTPSGTDTYTVNQVVLVSPQDVSVLQTEGIPSLTLVTCHPFYFIGSAPQRYIVQATLASSDVPSLHRRISSELRNVELGPNRR